MYEKIRKTIHEIENKHNVHVLSCRDTGSRAWNLHSPESDHDPEFIYLQNHENYITPNGYKQNITATINNQQIHGWNLDRFLQLYTNSNPATTEYMQSRIQYIDEPQYIKHLTQHIKKQFKPLALMKHYHNLAKKQYERYIASGKQPTVKRHIYVLRALTYRKYIQNTHKLPDINYPYFLENQLRHTKSWYNYRTELNNIVKQKQNGYKNNTVTNKKLHRKIKKDLSKKLTNEEKQELATRHPDKTYITIKTRRYIKDYNKTPKLWKQWINKIKSLKKN